MDEKTKGILLGATIMVVLASAAGVVLANGWNLGGEQRTLMFEKRAQLITENVSGNEFRNRMMEYAGTIGINNTGCGGFEDNDGNGKCDYTGECPMHVNRTATCGGSSGFGGCHAANEGGCGCQGIGADKQGEGVGTGCPFHNAGNTERLGGRQGCPFHNQ